MCQRIHLVSAVLFSLAITVTTFAQPAPAAPPPSQPAPVTRPPSPDGFKTKATRATFFVEATGRREGKDVRASGPGVLVGHDGLALVALDALLGCSAAKARFVGVTKAADLSLLRVVPEEGLALVRVNIADLPKKNEPQPLALSNDPVDAGDPVWGFIPSASGATPTILGTKAGPTKKLGDLPDKVAQDADFPLASEWFTTEPHLAQSSGLIPVVNSNGDLVGLAPSSPRGPGNGSIVRTLDTVRVLLDDAPKNPIDWTILADENTIEGTPKSLKPAFLRVAANIKPAAALNSSINKLKSTYICKKCSGHGTCVYKILVQPKRPRYDHRGIQDGFYPGIYRDEIRTCDICFGWTYDVKDSLYNSITKILWAQRNLPQDDKERDKLLARAKTTFDQLASWNLSGLSRTVTDRAIALLSGEPKPGETIILVGFLSDIVEQDGRRVYLVTVDVNFDLNLDTDVTMRVEVEAPDTTTAAIKEPVLVASLLERKAIVNGVTVGYLKGGAIHASRVDLREKR